MVKVGANFNFDIEIAYQIYRDLYYYREDYCVLRKKKKRRKFHKMKIWKKYAI